MNFYNYRLCFTDDSCDKLPVVCPADACTQGKMCKPNPDQGGYICVCPPGKKGQFCDEEDHYCTNSTCIKGKKGDNPEHHENQVNIFRRPQPTTY